MSVLFLSLSDICLVVFTLLATFATVKNQQPNIVTKMYAILRQLKRSYLLVALLLMGCLPVLAQTRTIQGKVTDAQNGEPLIGASVVVTVYVGESKNDQQANYGSDPSDLFKLSTADGNWNIWFKDDVNGNEVAVTADLNAMTWKYE